MPPGRSARYRTQPPKRKCDGTRPRASGNGLERAPGPARAAPPPRACPCIACRPGARCGRTATGIPVPGPGSAAPARAAGRRSGRTASRPVRARISRSSAASALAAIQARTASTVARLGDTPASSWATNEGLPVAFSPRAERFVPVTARNASTSHEKGRRDGRLAHDRERPVHRAELRASPFAQGGDESAVPARCRAERPGGRPVPGAPGLDRPQETGIEGAVRTLIRCVHFSTDGSVRSVRKPLFDMANPTFQAPVHVWRQLSLHGGEEISRLPGHRGSNGRNEMRESPGTAALTLMRAGSACLP